MCFTFKVTLKLLQSVFLYMYVFIVLLLFQLTDTSAGMTVFSLLLAEQCDFSMDKAFTIRNSVYLWNYRFFVSGDKAAQLFRFQQSFTGIGLSHCSVSNDKLKIRM